MSHFIFILRHFFAAPRDISLFSLRGVFMQIFSFYFLMLMMPPFSMPLRLRLRLSLFIAFLFFDAMFAMRH